MDDFFCDTPVFWDRLPESDKKEYSVLKKIIASPACKNRRTKSVEAFADVLETIKTYVVRGDSGDLYRGIVCGMFWSDDGDLAINTRQLRMLLNKCKSSINGSLQLLGYVSPHASTDTPAIIVSLFPFWKDNFRELRQWTIRRKVKESKVTVQPTPLLKMVSQDGEKVLVENSDYENSAETTEDDDGFLPSSPSALATEEEEKQLPVQDPLPSIEIPPPNVPPSMENMFEAGIDFGLDQQDNFGDPIAPPAFEINGNELWDLYNL